MAIADRWVLYAVNYHGGLITQITGESVALGAVLDAADADGMVDPTHVAVLSQQPVLRFTTSALAVALAACGIDAAIIDGSHLLDMYFQMLDPAGIRKTGSNAIKVAVGLGLLVPRGLRAPNGGAATLDYEAWAISADGSTAPIVVTTAQALPTGTPGVTARWTAGPVKINGTSIGEASVQSIAFDPGLRVQPGGGDGLVFNSSVSVMSRQPSFIVQTTNLAILNTLGISGTAQGDTDSVIYLRKLAQDGTRVGNATAEHISFSIDAGIWNADDAAAPMRAPGVATVRCLPRYDGTNAIVVISTAAAIA
jgi:hypothetical protein